MLFDLALLDLAYELDHVLVRYHVTRSCNEKILAYAYRLNQAKTERDTVYDDLLASEKDLEARQRELLKMSSQFDQLELLYEATLAELIHLRASIKG